MVGRTTEQHIQAGVAALHLEDQVITKRCGHLLNKEIVDENTFLSRIRAAVNARTQAHGDIIIIARSDALQSLGYDMAVSRLKAAVAVGADVAFLEGFSTIEEGRRVCKELAPTPVLLNMVPGGVTPQISVREAEKLGFKLIIYPGFALTPVYSTVLAAAKELRSTGDYKVLEGGNPKEIFNLCGLREAMAFDLGAGGNLYSKGV